MNADTGELRERVTIQTPTATTDAYLGQSQAWATLATVWAKVAPAKPSERIEAHAVGSFGAYDIEIQYRTDVTPTQRLSWTPYRGSAKTLQIHGVSLKDGRPDRLLLQCGAVE